MAGRRTARKAEIEQRRSAAIQMRIQGKAWDEVAAALGYGSRGAACRDVQRCLAERSADVGERADELRAIETAHLDALQAQAWQVLQRWHPFVQSGKIVLDLQGEHPLEDDGPVLAAIDRLLKISARRAALWGLDSPVKVETSGDVRYEIVGVDTTRLT